MNTLFRQWTIVAAVLLGASGTMPVQGGEMTMKLTSSAFAEHGDIPSVYTCEGKDVSPPLEWHGVPEETRGLVLIVDDPDAPDPKAPKMTWVHWLLYNIPAMTAGLPEGAATSLMPAGTLDGTNDWGRTGYGGPCPPIGRHRYFFKLYALDIALPDMGKPRKADLERAMKGHVLAHAELVGTYQKKKK